MQQPINIILKPGKDEFVRRRHPWVFSGAIARIEGSPSDGEVVHVCDKRGDLLGIGHYHNGSIAVRLLAFEQKDIQNIDFWIEKISEAVQIRRLANLWPDRSNGIRLIHGEGDGLSGLIIDLYGSTAVVQCHSIGMHRQRALIAQALQSVLGEYLTAIYDKSAESLPPKYAESTDNQYLWSVSNEPETATVIRENGVQFKVDWVHGQKTGFFLDQRDNRQLLAEFAPGKSVLNAFCYTGGFSCYALKAGAALVHSVDVSGKAMLLTDENVALNTPFAGQHEGFTADVMQFLKEGDRSYEVMVVDPPAFAKSLEKRHNAVQGYKRLNEMAIRRVKEGGVLFTFSCSQVVDRELFYHTIAAAAMEVGRNVRVLHHLTQGADHPVSMFHPEGSYLKGLVLAIN